MWVARDKSGVLLLFRFFPTRLIDMPCWRRDNNTIVLDSDLGLFPNLKWEDDPIEVKLFSLEEVQDISKTLWNLGLNNRELEKLHLNRQ